MASLRAQHDPHVRDTQMNMCQRYENKSGARGGAWAHAILVRAMIKPCQEEDAMPLLTDGLLEQTVAPHPVTSRSVSQGVRDNTDSFSLVGPVVCSEVDHFYCSCLVCPWSGAGGTHRVNGELQSTPAHFSQPLPTLSFVSPDLLHLYSLRPYPEYCEGALHCPCAACFPGKDTKEVIISRQGQIGWGSYLGRIIFDVLHHYQLPSPPPFSSSSSKSHISSLLMCH